ncbi:hypothetical protein [Paenibacillus flagellatus]|uniref:Spore coat protein n=1 Tax=Paenibacillus flagellatus TaxID=2211139 RepID=A0A2V5JZX6_9BACL|nr:hypothetical protein [Paenibacillus flagellatus]PYI52408.1 hypothetical protein DLM86_19680 [Paenibacillus flagellatus]
MKLLGWFGKVLVTAALAACISAVTTFYLVNFYVQELLKPFQAVLPENKIELSEFVVKLWTQSNILGQRATPQAGKESVPQPDTGKTVTTPPQDDAVAAWSQTGTGEAAKKEKVVMSEEQFLTKRDKLSEEDKSAVFSMLVSRLPQEQVQHLSTMIEDGITSSELEEMKKIVEQYVQPDEYAKLMDIVNKY